MVKRILRTKSGSQASRNGKKENNDMAELKEFEFKPHSDMEIDDLNIVDIHNQLINQNHFAQATKLLHDNYSKGKGFTATVLNNLQNKIRSLQLHILNDPISSEELILDHEPSDEQMEHKIFWIKEI